MQNIKERMEQRSELLRGLEMGPKSTPDVTNVLPLDNFRLHLTFADGEKWIFDMKPYCHGMFAGLDDPGYFSWVASALGRNTMA